MERITYVPRAEDNNANTLYIDVKDFPTDHTTDVQAQYTIWTFTKDICLMLDYRLRSGETFIIFILVYCYQVSICTFTF